MTTREQIVLEFFEKGHLLTEEALKVIEEQGAPQDVRLPLVIRAHDLRLPYKILKNITEKKTEITTDDFVRFYNAKYEKMRDIIVARAPKNYVSLNKIDGTRSETFVIGIVREIKEKDGKKIIDLEDKTATVPVIFDPAEIEDVELDDVIAVKAIGGGKVLFGKKVIFPDIPLRSPATGNGKACFISNLHLKEAPARDVEQFFEWFARQDIQFLFIAGGCGDISELEKLAERYLPNKTIFAIADGNEYPALPQKYSSGNIVPLSNPALVELNGLKILMVKHGSVSALKKRHIGHSKAIFDEDLLVMEEVPDIMHTGGAESPQVANYKSVTLVNAGSLLGEFQPIVVDFATRETEKVKL